MSDLDDLEMLASGGESTPPVDAAIPAITPRASGDETLKAQALAGLPAEWRERLIADAGHAGVRHDNDIGWLLVGSVVHSAMAAFAAGNAAAAVQAGVSQIPDQIFQGAVKAGGDVKGELVAASIKYAQVFKDASIAAQSDLIKQSRDQQNKIVAASELGAEKIRNAAETLTGTLDKAVERKTEEGVDVFARAAALAGQHAARAAAMSRFMLSMGGVAALLVLFMGLGGGAAWEYLNLTHRITAYPIVMLNGHRNCGWIDQGQGKQYVCELDRAPAA